MTELYTLVCPITHEIPEPDDIVVGSDNIVYSKKAILNWLTTSNKSPITKEQMTAYEIRVCPIIKRICEEINIKKKTTQSYVLSRRILPCTIETIDFFYEKAKLRRSILFFIINQGYSIFGSSSYKMCVNNKNMIDYYNYCKHIKHCTTFINYNNKKFHPSSYYSRQDLKTINDIDIYQEEGNIEKIILELKSFLHLCIVTVSENNIYKNSCFKRYNTIKTVDIKLPVAMLGNINMKIDIIVSKNIHDLNGAYGANLGVYPNIIKRVFTNKSGYYYGDLQLNVYYNIELINWCVNNYHKKRTLTNIISYNAKSFGNDINDINDIISDIIIYIEKLVKELLKFSIDNLSITINGDLLKYQVWNNNNTKKHNLIFNCFNKISYLDLIFYIKNIKNDIEFDISNELNNLSHGKIKINDNEYINICCDPDFDILTYNNMLINISRDQYS